jgi:tetratricopeptide (TPR) repeat protein
METKDEVFTINLEEIPEHVKLGQDNFNSGKYADAIKEFNSVLEVAPDNIDARIWLRKAQQSLSSGGDSSSPCAEGVKAKECLWMKMGMIEFRICTNDYNCVTCEFDQEMQQKTAGESSELDAALDKLKQLPGNKRTCRYALKGDISQRICSRLFQCQTCEFGQGMEDAMQQKLAKLAVRREAMAKREAKDKTA